MKSQPDHDQVATIDQSRKPATDVSRSIDWYAEGEQRIVEADGIRVAIRFVGRKGRRGRIAITAPPGAAFFACDRNQAIQPPDRLL